MKQNIAKGRILGEDFDLTGKTYRDPGRCICGKLYSPAGELSGFGTEDRDTVL